MSYEEGSSKGTSVLERLIQVRMSSGKIYGPYKRIEIIEFIRKGKIRGEEEILVEGDVVWRAISSDTEFFDELQKALLGIEAEVEEEKIPEKRKSKKEKKTKTIALPKTQAGTPEPQQESEDLRPKMKEVDVSGTAAGLPAAVSPSHPPFKGANSGAPFISDSSKRKKPNPIFIVLLFVVVVGFAFVWIKNHSSDSGSGSSVDFSKVTSNKFYAQHLLREIRRLPRLPELPNTTLKQSSRVEFPVGWGVHVWVADLEKLLSEKDLSKREETSYWTRFVWDLLWTASTVHTVDKNISLAMSSRAREIYALLKKQKALSADVENLIEAIFLFDAAKWPELETLLSSNSLPEAMWLRDEARWIRAWSEENAFDPASPSQAGGDLWQLSSQVRTHFFQSPSLLVQSLEQLAELDPFSYHLWFSAAQFYWKGSTGAIERSMRYFLIGFSTLSLYPIPVQEMVWEQFFKYLSAHSRKALVERALQNKEIIHSGESFLAASSRNWWDLGEEGLDVNTAIGQIYQKVKTSRAELVDLAALTVLGPVTPQGNDYLVEVAYRAAFDKNWDRAENLFSQIVKKDPKNILALGGKIWAESNLYLFDQAFEDLTKISQAQAQNGEYDRYNGLILATARDYDEAERIWGEHIRKFPADDWTYFFVARMKEDLEKNYECVKSAGLARLHASGELKARSDLLFYRCGIKAGVGVKEAVAEIERMQQQAPNDISIQLEHVDALVHSKKLSDAIQMARNYVEKSPRSYDLRLKLGDVYSLKGDFDRAVAFYNNAVELRPRSAEAFVKIAKVLEELKRIPEAAQNYETAATVQPSYPDVFLFAARSYVKLKNIGKAAEMYVREIQARPAAVTTFLEATEFFLANNAAQEVPKLYKLYSEEFQQDPRVLTRLAQAYLGMGQFENARLNAATALVGDQKLPEPHRILGESFEGLGNYDAAKKHYELYLNLLPAAPEASQIRSKISQPPFPQ